MPPWTYWCNNTITSNTVTYTTVNSGIWLSWTTSGTTTANTTWYQWTSAATVSTELPPPQRTAEEQAADNARWAVERAANEQRAAEAAEKRRLACETARRLLLSMLDVKQREQLQKDRFFEVVARHSQRRYRIREGTHGNVKLLDATGREVTSYCGQPGGVPTEDSMLAQKLQLEHDEPAFLRVANATRLQVA